MSVWASALRLKMVAICWIALLIAMCVLICLVVFYLFCAAGLKGGEAALMRAVKRCMCSLNATEGVRAVLTSGLCMCGYVRYCPLIL